MSFADNAVKFPPFFVAMPIGPVNLPKNSSATTLALTPRPPLITKAPFVVAVEFTPEFTYPLGISTSLLDTQRSVPAL